MTIQIYRKVRGAKIIGIDDEFEEGTLCWLETPLNPGGESRYCDYHGLTLQVN